MYLVDLFLQDENSDNASQLKSSKATKMNSTPNSNKKVTCLTFISTPHVLS